MRKRIYQLAVLSAILGLAILLCVIVSGAAYPHPFFQFGAPLGLLFVFVSVALLFVSWIWEIGHNVKGKQYLLAAVTAVLGLLAIWRLLSRL